LNDVIAKRNMDWVKLINLFVHEWSGSSLENANCLRRLWLQDLEQLNDTHAKTMIKDDSGKLGLFHGTFGSREDNPVQADFMLLWHSATGRLQAAALEARC
jgi:hypothetical protein